MNYKKKIRLLIITDNGFLFNKNTIQFRDIDYEVVCCYRKLEELKELSTVCDHHFDMIISETFEFEQLRIANNCLMTSEADDANNICKHFFKFHGTFILLNSSYDEYGYSKNGREQFPYCSYYKEISVTTEEADKIKCFEEAISLLLFKHLALSTNFLLTGTLVIDFLKKQLLDYKFYLQIFPYVLLLIIIGFHLSRNRSIENWLLDTFSFPSSHLYSKFAVIRPISLLLVIYTCVIYGLFYLKDLFGLMNFRGKRSNFDMIYVLSVVLLAGAIYLSLLRLIDGRATFDGNEIKTISSDKFLYTDLTILILLLLVDLVILIGAYLASKGKYLTKREEISLSNIYSLYVNTLLFCDVPILLGSIFMYLYELRISQQDYHFIYSLGTTSVSLFVLQLIYFGINSKSTYNEYLTS